MIYKNIYRNAASLPVDGFAACPAIIKFTKPSTIVTRCLTADYLSDFVFLLLLLSAI